MISISYFRDNKYSALGLLTGYHLYTFSSQVMRLGSFGESGLGLHHTKMILTALFTITEGSYLKYHYFNLKKIFSGITILSLLALHALDLTLSMKSENSMKKSSTAYKFTDSNIISK